VGEDSEKRTTAEQGVQNYLNFPVRKSIRPNPLRSLGRFPERPPPTRGQSSIVPLDSPHFPARIASIVRIIGIILHFVSVTDAVDSTAPTARSTPGWLLESFKKTT
jgi:hypothetical protein